MFKESKSLPVPEIHRPEEGSHVINPFYVQGSGNNAKQGDWVQIVTTDGTTMAVAQVDEYGEWKSAFPKVQPGDVAITARLTRGTEFSLWTPERQFKVE